MGEKRHNRERSAASRSSLQRDEQDDQARLCLLPAAGPRPAGACDLGAGVPGPGARRQRTQPAERHRAVRAAARRHHRGKLPGHRIEEDGGQRSRVQTHLQGGRPLRGRHRLQLAGLRLHPARRDLQRGAGRHRHPAEESAGLADRQAEHARQCADDDRPGRPEGGVRGARGRQGRGRRDRPEERADPGDGLLPVLRPLRHQWDDGRRHLAEAARRPGQAADQPRAAAAAGAWFDVQAGGGIGRAGERAVQLGRRADEEPRPVHAARDQHP